MTDVPAGKTARLPKVLVLASASPARLATLRAAGIDPVVLVSGVDEQAIADALAVQTPESVVSALAEAKARAVAATSAREHPDAVVVGCDSMLHLGDDLLGKPADEDDARRRWADLAGSTGALLTGHAVLRVSSGEVIAEAIGTSTTIVRFGAPTPAELDAYLASGEPLGVAGAFTIDGLGGWFVDGVDGDPSSVVGISLPLTRRLLADVGVPVTDLWSRPTVRPLP